MTDIEEKTVKDVTNALLDEFAVGDDVIVVTSDPVALKDFPYINGCITKVLAIGKPGSHNRYQIGIKTQDGKSYVWANINAIRRYQIPETP